MKIVHIYSLNDPIDGSVRYVGKTQNSLPIRLKSHLVCNGNNHRKDLWINDLKEKGRKPTINLLEVANEGTWAEREIYWTEYYLDKGIDLLNDKLDGNHKAIIFRSYRRELTRLSYRINTIENYCSIFLKFLVDFNGSVYAEISKDDLIDYLSHLVETKKISWSYQNQIINAIKFYYEKVLGRKRETYYINRPKRTRKIRPILTVQQVEMFIDNISYLKQKALFQTMYSGALRTGEVIALLVTNINFEERKLKIIDAKGGNDRIISLPEQTTNLLKIYIEEFKPKHWLFEGQNKSNHYSSGAVQEKFEQVIKKLGYDLNLTPHCLRHSRLSHVLNNGVKIEMASKYAGHKSISTTADIYHHYMHAEMQEQFDEADERIMGKMNKNKMEDHKKLSTSERMVSIHRIEDTAKEKVNRLTSSDKTYNIQMNGKTYLLKAMNNKIVDAPEGAKWSIGVTAEKALAWFTKKGASINNQASA